MIIVVHASTMRRTILTIVWKSAYALSNLCMCTQEKNNRIHYHRGGCPKCDVNPNLPTKRRLFPLASLRLSLDCTSAASFAIASKSPCMFLVCLRARSLILLVRSRRASPRR